MSRCSHGRAGRGDGDGGGRLRAEGRDARRRGRAPGRRRPAIDRVLGDGPMVPVRTGAGARRCRGRTSTSAPTTRRSTSAHRRARVRMTRVQVVEPGRLRPAPVRAAPRAVRERDLRLEHGGPGWRRAGLGTGGPAGTRGGRGTHRRDLVDAARLREGGARQQRHVARRPAPARGHASPPAGRRYVGTINAQNQVERVQHLDRQHRARRHADRHRVHRLSRLRRRAPSRAASRAAQGGHPVLELTVVTVTANPAVDDHRARGRARLHAAGRQRRGGNAGAGRAARHRRFAPQHRHRSGRSHRGRRGPADRGALGGRHRDGQGGDSEQADPLPGQLARALRSLGRPAHLRGRGRDDRDARGEHAVLRAGVGGAADPQPGSAGQVAARPRVRDLHRQARR